MTCFFFTIREKKINGCLFLLKIRVTILFFLSFCQSLTIQAFVNFLMGFTTPSSSFKLTENCQGRFQPKKSLIIVTPEEPGMF